VNRQNAAISPGDIRGGGEEFFTTEDIRRMSREEVRERYDAVLRSLEHTSR